MFLGASGSGNEGAESLKFEVKSAESTGPFELTLGGISVGGKKKKRRKTGNKN